MASFDDLLHEMERRGPGEETVDRLLAGAIAPEDAPPELFVAARILRAAAAPALPEELAHEEAAVTAFAAVTRSHTTRARRSHVRVRTRRVVMLAAALVLVGAGIAVAAADLPGEADEKAHTIIEELGIAFPYVSENAVGPSATGEEISEIATSDRTTGLEKGSEVAATASGGMSETGTDVAQEAVSGADAAGAAGANAGAGRGRGAETAGTASGGADRLGTDVAADAAP